MVVMNQNIEFALITGASSGIGRDFALKMAAKGKPVILVGRSIERLEAVKAQLKGLGAEQSLCFSVDLSKPGSAQELFTLVKTAGLKVNVLINNAGSGLFGACIDADPDQVEAMISLNISSLTNLCTLFGADMSKEGSGKILNIGSFAGLNATPYFAAYAATKSYVLNFSLALRTELASKGVSVTCLLPGYVATAFDDNAGIKSKAYKQFSKTNSLDSNTVAEIGLKALEQGRAYIIAGARNRLAAFFMSMLPKSVAPSIMKLFLDKLV